ncbi:xylulokinase [Chelativorans salis]|uniref:Xylulose kinase n=1 Tax=Chelativorans salis TaxID=2978478 RepID=A0ABT2LTG1_9HYPH|nr:xylulokinase [Chelativorans sp. EGI FJ00035]MCT7377820.1 xylulokinase [Chelativorans sp. EGI FJ00035]
MFAGIDIGTSGVKAILVNDDHQVLGTATRNLSVTRLQDGWSEQHPDEWWDALCAVFDELAAVRPAEMAALSGIGLSGQMLGTVLIDKDDRPVRRAILWNDGRAVEEARRLQVAVPDMGQRSCIDPDPGFGAPKLMWLARHEPETIEKADCLLLPKDYVRLKLTGERASEPSDASGTLLFDNRRMAFASDLAEAAGFALEKLPRLINAWEPAGELRRELCERWGIQGPVVVAGGAGDNLACKIGVGAARPERGVLTIGTSGVLCVSTPTFRPIPGKGVQTPPHAAPGQFSSQGVAMSATSAVNWMATIMGTHEAELDGQAETLLENDPQRIAGAPVILPYLDGVRTPHKNARLRGLADMLSLSTTREMLAWAVFEGVAFHFAEVVQTQRDHGITCSQLQVVGGGSQSRIWPRMIAALYGIPIILSKGRANAAAMGAAKLAMAAAYQPEDPLDLLAAEPELDRMIEPEPDLAALLGDRRAKYEKLRDTALDRVT